MGKCDADSGVLFSACLPVSQSLQSGARCCDAGSGVVSPASPSDVVSPACLPVSPSLCGQMRDAVTRRLRGVSQAVWVVSPARLPVSQLPDAVALAAGLCLPLVSLCLPRSLRSDASWLRDAVSGFSRSDARCCDAGSGVVSPACLPVSQMPDARWCELLIVLHWLRWCWHWSWHCICCIWSWHWICHFSWFCLDSW